MVLVCGIWNWNKPSSSNPNRYDYFTTYLEQDLVTSETVDAGPPKSRRPTGKQRRCACSRSCDPTERDTKEIKRTKPQQEDGEWHTSVARDNDFLTSLLACLLS